MNFSIKYHFSIIFLFLLIILNGCQLQDPLKPHGIIYLENRSNKIQINKSNRNDVISIFGQPHIKDKEIKETWVYLERVLTKGKFHKLGQHVLKENNVLVLKFDKFGILEKKDFITKEDMNDIKFSNKETDNILTQRSFVQKFLQSVKQKMYMNRK